MCLLILKPADKTLLSAHLENGACQNPHGAGVAIADGNKLIIQKSPKWGAEEVNNVLEKFAGHPAMVHFRFATHGSKNYLNTHPFWLNDDWCAAHNGVISNIACQTDESDTRAFLRLHVRPFLRDNISLNDTDILNLLGEEMGSYNKMVFLSAQGDFGIANENSGHWFNGLWYSNHGYEDMSSYYDEYYGMMGHNHSRHIPRLPYSPNSSCRIIDNPHEFESIDESELNSTPYDQHDAVAIDHNKEDEVWHKFDARELRCDACSNIIDGEFRVASESGLVVCDMCQFFSNYPSDI